MGISSDIIRGYNDPIILSCIKEEPSYGYEISKTIRERTDYHYVIKETTLYSAFKRLEKNGYVTSYVGKETNGKKRTYYQITSLGEKYLAEKIDEWQLTKDVIERFI